jgi:tRNA threonylcarbamoyladenosine biosynthesis protein TsaE
MSTTLVLRHPEEARDLARALLAAVPDARIFAFHGDLGAGKTTVIKALCSELGVAHGTASPSFAIVNEYSAATGDPVYHFDLYRLRDASELEGIGFTEYLDSGHFCFVEWPGSAAAQLPPDTVHVHIRAQDDGQRILELRP